MLEGFTPSIRANYSTKSKDIQTWLAYLRKIGYEAMQNLKTHGASADNSVYQFILKKELEGKFTKAAKIEGLNKFS